MLKIDSVMRNLTEVDQSSVAFEVYHAYFREESVPKAYTVPSQLAHKESTKDPPLIHKESTKRGATPEVSQDLVLSESLSNGSTRQLHEESKQLLSFLNEKTGKSYRAVETNLLLIKSCLKSGATFDECRGVIARKVRDWKGTEFEKYLRPVTLFNKTKFEQYLGEQPHA